MMSELKELGYEPIQMLPVRHPITKLPLPLFFLDLKHNPKNPEIYSLTRLYNGIIKVEPPKPRKTIVQCMRCQQFGHTRNFCNQTARCVKCEGLHPTEKCNKPKDTPPICTNCKGIIQPTTEVVLNIQDYKEEQLGIRQFHIDLNQHQEHLL
ncbi:hypothetical protein ANN_04445 [Periplaneta americana]|uniref:Pre-C2HC domain-containing protein n=1 Tax=Periplaneta americana TaxID=6978 RepID=A0ABQ8TAE1_PERAM|nr:hypothetical protein ANN_04445 [Periplaneta americana]